MLKLAAFGSGTLQPTERQCPITGGSVERRRSVRQPYLSPDLDHDFPNGPIPICGMTGGMGPVRRHEDRELSRMERSRRRFGLEKDSIPYRIERP